MEKSGVSRRELLGVVLLGAMALPAAAGAQDEIAEEVEEAVAAVAPAPRPRAGAEMQTAEMGADVLDRKEFRRRQDLFTEAPVSFPDGVGNIKLPVNGRPKLLSKLLGRGATIVVNVKLDDPETISQVPAIRSMVAKYAAQGLNVICVATDQGDYEPDDSPTVRIKLAQQFGLVSSSKGPVIVTDKTDIVGKFSHPLYKYMTTNMPNPNDVTRITLNYEKFLLDSEGSIMRRYPRQWSAERMEADIQAVLKGEELPEESKKLLFAWREADKESTRSIYSFRKHYNYYDQSMAGQDWAGTKSEVFVPGSNEARWKGMSRGKPLEVPVAD